MFPADADILPLSRSGEGQRLFTLAVTGGCVTWSGVYTEILANM